MADQITPSSGVHTSCACIGRVSRLLAGWAPTSSGQPQRGGGLGGHRSNPALRVFSAVTMLIMVSGCERLFESRGGVDGDATTLTGNAPVPQRPAVLTRHIAASVNGVAISTQDVELRVQELKAQLQFVNPDQPWEPLTAQELEGVMDELIEAELMSQHAVESGVMRSLEMQRRWEFLRRRFLAEEWVRANQDTLVTNTEVERYYEENVLGFREPERIKLRQLTVTTPTEAKQALARLHGEGVEFTTLAREMSIGPTAVQGGVIREWIMRSNEKLFLYGSEEEASTDGVISLDPVLEGAAFAIDHAGGVSNYVTGPDGRYHVFQLVEREDGGQRTLTEVWDWIKQSLFLEKLQQVVDGLSAKATIERYAERVWDVEQ